MGQFSALIDNTYYNEDFQALETRKAGSASAYEQHVWDLRYIDAPILRYRDTDANGSLNETLYATYDGNYNVTGLVQENQTFVERYVYTPYGDRKVLDYNFATDADGVTDYDWQLGHQGLRIDPESGTYYNKGRQELHPGLGLFTQRDPLLTRYRDGMSLYQPYGGNPVNGVDPSGLETDDFGVYWDPSINWAQFPSRKPNGFIPGMGFPPGHPKYNTRLTPDELQEILQERRKNNPCPKKPCVQCDIDYQTRLQGIYKKFPEGFAKKMAVNGAGALIIGAAVKGAVTAIATTTESSSLGPIGTVAGAAAGIGKAGIGFYELKIMMEDYRQQIRWANQDLQDCLRNCTNKKL